MGYFLAMTWPWWLAALVLAVVITLVIFLVLDRRRGAKEHGERSAGAESAANASAADESAADKGTADKATVGEGAGHVSVLNGRKPAEAALLTESTLPAESAPKVKSLQGELAASQDACKKCSDDLATAKATIADLEITAGEVPALKARIAELEAAAAAVPQQSVPQESVPQESVPQVSVAEPEPVPAPTQAAEPESVPEPEPVAESEPEPAPESEPASAPSPVSESEPEPEPEKAPVPDLKAAAAALGHSVKADDLAMVEGIGPKIRGLLNAENIRTWRDLATTEVATLEEILDKAGPRYQMHSPATWPRQAELLANGEWERFKEWTDALKGGREVTPA